MTSISTQINDQTRTWAPRIAAGALAGLIASIPMGLVMIGLNRLIMVQPEPPKQITQRVARRLGIGNKVRGGRTWDAATWAAHLGYGAGTASLYPLITRWLPLPNLLRGIVFAMGIWAASYMGWLPAANILPPANKQPARRNVVMILSHILWGSLTGVLTRAFEDRGI